MDEKYIKCFILSRKERKLHVQTVQAEGAVVTKDLELSANPTTKRSRKFIKHAIRTLRNFK